MTDSFILPINKPPAMSSYDVIRRAKRHVLPSLSPKTKIGHAGTLDVFAYGLLLLLFGSATKKFDQFQTSAKTYRAVARLGASTPTLDTEGVVSMQQNTPRISREQMLEMIPTFLGSFDQKIPAFSATKSDGKTMYELARKGVELNKTKAVTVHSIQLVSYMSTLACLEVTVSSGTYIRQLSYDLFRTLGVESFLTSLTRTQIGEVTLRQSCELRELESNGWEKYAIVV